MPLIFQGEEWGASSPFQDFGDQDPSTFRRSILDWTELVREPHRSVSSWYAALIALRRGQPDLRDGRRDRVVIHRDPDGAWLVVRRGAVTLTCNLGTETVRLPGPEGDLYLSSGDEPRRDGDKIVLLPDGCAIWVVD